MRPWLLAGLGGAETTVDDVAPSGRQGKRLPCHHTKVISQPLVVLRTRITRNGNRTLVLVLQLHLPSLLLSLVRRRRRWRRRRKSTDLRKTYLPRHLLLYVKCVINHLQPDKRGCGTRCWRSLASLFVGALVLDPGLPNGAMRRQAGGALLKMR